MADTVTVTKIFNGARRKVYHLTNLSDGSGESAVVKVDISTETFGGQAAPAAFTPTYTTIDMLDYFVGGFASVRLHWAHTTPDLIAVLPSGSGTLYFNATGGITDPKSAGSTGDITVTTNGGASGSTYDIVAYVRGHP